jgi:hypothetical protein
MFSLDVDKLVPAVFHDVEVTPEYTNALVEPEHVLFEELFSSSSRLTASRISVQRQISDFRFFASVFFFVSFVDGFFVDRNFTVTSAPK